MSFLDDLDALTQRERARIAADEQQKANDQRFDRLEAGQKETLELLRARQDPPERSSSGGEGGDGPGAAHESDPGPGADDEKEDNGPELPLERVSKMDVPRIWNGDDEPSSVKYLDADTGEEKTRKGRKKGQPYGYNVEDVDDSEAPGEDAA